MDRTVAQPIYPRGSRMMKKDASVPPSPPARIGGAGIQAEAVRGRTNMAPPQKSPPSKTSGDGGGACGEYCPPPPPHPFTFHRIEVSVISAQDLYAAGRSMSTYAVAYLQSDHRPRTRVDSAGHTDPSWNDKFVFRVEDADLRSDTASITIEVYGVRSGIFLGGDTHLGTARAVLSTLRPSTTLRYAALQIRRPTSLRPQGILNLGIAIIDPPARSQPDHGPISSTPKPEVPKSKRRNASAHRAGHHEKTEMEKKLEQWRAEIPPVSGEVVREDKVGRAGGGRGHHEGGRLGGSRAPRPPPVEEDRPLARLEKKPSFGRWACFGGGNVESGEFVPAPRYVKERPRRRGAMDY